MAQDPHANVFTIGIGGAAGDGIREAGNNLALLLTKLGYEVYLSFTYPSLIKGGHNYARISFSSEKIWCDHGALDLLIAINEETVKLHEKELHPNAVLIAEKFDKDDIITFGGNAIALPLAQTAADNGAPNIAKTSVALGAFSYLLDIPLDHIKEILGKVFAEKGLEANIKLGEIGYGFMEKLNFRHWKKLDPGPGGKELLEGNMAFGKGLVRAGLEYYVAYPMTPSSSILHYLAKEQKNLGIRVIQPENEIAVINMALGMAYAGKRVALGTAGGGFALMQEATSFSGIAELPVAIAVSQRQAPATGAPTASAQTDLRFIIHSGHGEFPKLVMAPGDPEESFKCGTDALNLAWKYQLPVIVILDKQLSENSMTAAVPQDKQIERGKIDESPNAGYGRYKFTDDGVSPMAFPGKPEAIVKITSYEHDENGYTVDEPEKIGAMAEKRFKKGEALEREFGNFETVKVYGDANAENAIVFWGSTKGMVLEAAKYIEKPLKLVQIVWMEPFDSKKVAEVLGGAKNIIDVECNHNAQVASLIREKTGINIEKKILRYDARTFDPLELAEKINSLI